MKIVDNENFSQLVWEQDDDGRFLEIDLTDSRDSRGDPYDLFSRHINAMDLVNLIGRAPGNGNRLTHLDLRSVIIRTNRSAFIPDIDTVTDALLTSCKSLKSIRIKVADRWRGNDLWKVVPPLLTSTVGHSLKSVYLSNCDICKVDEVRELFAACTACQTLESLVLWENGRDATEIPNSVVDLIIGTTSIKKLRFPAPRPSNGNLVPIANALKMNTSIQYLTIDRYSVLRDDEIKAFCDVLKDQYTLKYFQVRGDAYSDFSGVHPLGKTIDFYLSLNMQGRGDLLGQQGQNQSIQDWMGDLARQSDSFIYYYLRHDPSIFFSNLKQQQPTLATKTSSRKRTHNEMMMSVNDSSTK